MKKAMVILLIVLLAIAGGVLAFKHFVTDQIMDRDGMVNYQAAEEDITLLDAPSFWEDGSSFDEKADLAQPWQGSGEHEGYAVNIDTEASELSLYKDGELICSKRYYVMADGIYRIFADEDGFGEFDYFDYSPGALTGCIGSDSEEPVYVELSH